MTTVVKSGNPLRLLSILSLDVTAGSLAGGFLVTYLLDISMPLIWYFLLPLCVWLIYSLDHLIDAHKLGEQAHTRRHLFHHKYFKTLSVVWTLLATGGLISALLFLPLQGIYFGLGMVVMVLLHLGLVSIVGGKTSPFLVKEGGVALIYTLGIWGMPMVLHWELVEPIHLAMMGQFCFLALANLLEFSVFEKEIDELDGHSSLVLAIGVQKSIILVMLLLAAVLCIAGVVFWTEGMGRMLPAQGIYLLMAAVLWLILNRPDYFDQENRYRSWGDAIFIFPILILLF